MIPTKQFTRLVMLLIFCTSMMFYTKLSGLLSLQLNVSSFDEQSALLPSQYNFKSAERSSDRVSKLGPPNTPPPEESQQQPPPGQRIIIYNRVPKTGSTTMANLFYEAAQLNKVSVLIANFSKVAGVISVEDQMEFVQNISQWTSVHPVIVHGHFPYLNFNKFGVQESPVHVSIVRDPLERLVSSYYFKRYGDTFHGNKRHSKYRDTTTFDECVSRNLSECSADAMWFQIPYFCGNFLFCNERGNMDALGEAKSRVMNDYLLVGTTEKLDQFAQLIETLLPLHLGGMTNIYKGSGYKRLRKTKHKDQLQQSTIEALKNSTAYQMEAEFYRFVDSQFARQFARSRDRAQGKHREGEFAFKYEKVRLKNNPRMSHQPTSFAKPLF